MFMLLLGQTILACRLFLLVPTSHHTNSSMHDGFDQASTLHDNDELDQVEENDEVAQHRHHLEQHEKSLTEVIGVNTCVGW